MYILIYNDDTPHLLSVDNDSCRCVCDCVICPLFTDLKALNESIRNVKAVELKDPSVETVLSALSGQVEELRLTVLKEVCYPLQCLCTYSVLHTSGTCVLHIRSMCATHIRYMCMHVLYIRYMCMCYTHQVHVCILIVERAV